MSEDSFQMYPGTHLIIKQHGHKNFAPRILKIAEKHNIGVVELVEAILHKGQRYYKDIGHKPFEGGLKTVIAQVNRYLIVIIDDAKKIAIVYDE